MTTEPDNGRDSEAARRIEAELTGQEVQETLQSGFSNGQDFEDSVGDVVAECLKIPPDRFDMSSPLSRFGVDSIIVTEIMKRLSDMLGASIAPTVFFEAKTARELAFILAERYRREAAPISQTSPQQAKKPPVKGPPADPITDKKASRSTKAAAWIASAKSGLKNAAQLSRVQEDADAAKAIGAGFEPIAILAMDGRFAQSADLKELQSHLEQGDDCITEIPAERWNWQDIYGDPEKGELTRVKYGGFAPAIDQFDPIYFGLSPREAELMDPQHRLFIQSAYRLLGEAGYAPSALAGRSVGVFIGVNLQDYAHLIDRAGSIEALHLTSLGHMFCPNRLSFMLDITGPSQVIDTACSSSLIAVHRAVLALQHEGCEMAIAGGANFMLTPDMHIMYSKVGMLSEDGRCKTFSARANGYVRGDGVGAVLLKPLSAAERDGDSILAVIRGSSENHGGQSTSLTAPNPNAQARLIAEAHRHAGGDPRTVGYVECHGTGTELGDPIEINGLKQAFAALYDSAGLSADGAPHCGLGSIKSNIGHAETAAGIAGLIKAVMGMRTGRYFPTLHAQDQNPLIDLEQTPFFLTRNGGNWPRPVLDGQTFPRRAGVSSFGAGGSNAHVVIEEYIPLSRPAEANGSGQPVLLPLSARTEEQLEQVVEDLLAHLDEMPRDQRPQSSQIAYTLQTGRDPMVFRLAFVTETVGSMIETLRKLKGGDWQLAAKGRVKSGRKARETAKPVDMNQALPDLAAAWVSGALLDWAVLYDSRPSRVRLPAYPFEKRRCWIPAAAGDVASGRRAPAVSSKKIGFELVVQKREAEEACFGIMLTGGERFLKDHVIGGVCLLPAAAYLELARAAAAQFLEAPQAQAWRFDKIVWVQPCAVTGGPVELALRCTMRPDGAIAFRITGSPDEQLHCQGVVKRFEPDGRVEGTGRTVEPEGSADSVQENTKCYHRFAELGLAYGPSHRGLQRIWNGTDNEAYAEIVRPGAADDQGFLLDPAMLDCVLQSCLGLAGQEEVASASLPFELDSLELFGEVPDRLLVHVRFAAQNTGLPRVDLDVTDPEGRKVMNLRGFASRELNPAAELGLPEEKVLRGRPVWSPVMAGPMTTRATKRLYCGVAVHPGIGERAKVVPVSGDVAADYLQAAKTVFAEFKAAVKSSQGTGLLQILVPQPDEASGTDGLFAGLSGLVATANKESTRLKAQLVECPINLPAADIPVLLQTASGVSGVSHLRLSSQGILARGWEQLEISRDEIPWRDDGIYLITGGTGGLGQRFAEHIAHVTSAATVILTARNPANGDLIARLETLGLKVDSLTCDLGDAGAVHAMVRSVVAQYGRIDGVLHAAGVLKDSYIAEKTETDFDLVGRAKVTGTLALDQATAELHLDFFALFGSASAIWGSAGQTDYAAANGFLEAFALWRDRKVGQGERFGVSLNIAWPLWQEGGMRMAPEAFFRMRETTGQGSLATASGIEVFESALLSGGPQQVVLCGTEAAVQALLAPPVATDEANSSPDEREPDGLHFAIEAVLLEQIAGQMGFDPQDLDAEAEWSDLGFDSITMTTFSNHLNTEYGLDLTPTVFFEYATVADMADFLAESYASFFTGLRTEIPVIPIGDPEDLSPLAQQTVDALPEDEAIAIIGMAGRFPESPDLDTFWENLRRGRDCLCEIPADRWDWRALMAAGLTDVHRGGFIDGIADFDTRHFGISRREATLMDPAQRLLMEYVWRVIEDAGYAPSSLAGSDTGVIIGTAPSGYGALMAESGIGIDSHSSTGSVGSVGPNRVSYLLDLHGPSEPVETACSSALVALHRAISAIRAGDCGQAIVGGVNLILSPETHISFSKAGMLSRDGRSKTFSAKADGYGRGEGVGMLFLKPLSAAKRDGDFVHGVILGSAENHGGKANSLTAPNPRAQAALVEKAVRRASVDPQSVSYIEAHGTGTQLGDPVEIEGLKSAFEALDAASGAHCAIGSVKANIGHLELAAGVAGVLKVLLQMRHRTLAPSLPEETNPYLKLEGSPFYLVSQAQPWERPVDHEGKELPRRAGVSSFGFGGVNAHVVLEEPEQDQRAEMPATRELFVLSSRDRKGISANAAALVEALSSYAGDRQTADPAIEAELCTCLAAILEVGPDDIGPHTDFEDLGVDPVHRPLLRRSAEEALGRSVDHDVVHRAGSIAEISRELLGTAEHAGAENAPLLRDIAFTLRVGRDAMAERVAFSAASLEELIDALRLLASGNHDLAEREGFWQGTVARRSGERRKTTRTPEGLPLDELARLWVNGTAFDWEAQRAGCDLRRISLPGTVFAKERIWFDMLDGASPAEDTKSAEAPAPGTLSMHHVSDGVFEVLLTGTEIFLRDHLVQGQPVLPGVAYLEMARSAGCLHLQTPNLILKDVVWIQPAVITAPQALQVVFDGPSREQVIPFRIVSRSDAGETLHCRGAITAQSLEPQDYLDIGDIPSGRRIPATEIYATFEQAGLSYGPGHQSLDWLVCDGSRVVAEIALPEVCGSAVEPFVLHPSLMDGALQAAIGFGLARDEEAGALMLPFAIESFDCSVANRRRMKVHLRRREGASSSHGIEKIDIALCDEAGKVLTQINGFSTRQVVPPKTERLASQTASTAPNGAPGSAQEDLKNGAAIYFKRLLSETLACPPEEIDLDEPLEYYGFDSHMVMELTAVLEKQFGTLSKTLFFEHQTLAAVLDHFIGAHGPSLTEVVRKETGSNGTSAKAGAATARRPEPKTGGLDIAVIGLAGRYPQAYDIAGFWDNLRNGRDSIAEVPSDRWKWQDYYSDDRTRTDAHFSKWGGFIDDVAAFDPLFFNISPGMAEAMDPQERLFLEQAWAAMEDAGYRPKDLQTMSVGEDDLPGQVGVYVGVMYGEYQLFGLQGSLTGQGTSTASYYAGVANRVSYALNLHGPSMAVDTMCSSSLTAIHLACADLALGRSRMAFAGGVNLNLHPNKYSLLSKGQFISSNGCCQAFGNDGDGYVPSEGVGVVLLKPLADAEADGDHIYGVIKSSALNHGGRTNGYTVPNPEAQHHVIARALREADIDPRAIGYIEAHGTGTKLGDPIEIKGLNDGYGPVLQGQCWIGSAKSNIGHGEAVSGLAGLTKVLLQLKAGEIAPSLHAGTLNPNIDFEATPFRVNTRLRSWDAPVLDGKTVPRVSAVSSFGAGGSNAHLMVEEYFSPARAEPSPSGPVLIILSAKTEDRLKAYASALAHWVKTAPPTVSLQDLAYTLQIGREAMPHRIGVLAGSLVELAQYLRRYLAGYDGPVRSGRARVSSNPPLENPQGYPLEDLLDGWMRGVVYDWPHLYSDTVRRLSLPTYPFAREVYWPDSLSRPAALAVPNDVKETKAPEPAPEPQTDLLLFRPQWRDLPQPGSVSEPVLRRVAHIGPMKKLQDCTQVRLPEGDPEDPATFTDQAVALLQDLKELALQRSDQKIHYQLLVPGAYARSAALGGMLNSAAREIPRLTCQVLSYETDEPTDGDLEGDLAAAARTGESRLRRSEGNWQGLDWKVHDNDAEVQFGAGWQEGGRYLIAGGAGGLGALVARHLAQTLSRVSLVLTGRSEPGPKHEALLQDLRAKGATARYLATDLGDAAAVRALIRQITDQGPLHGVVHSGGVLADSLIMRKTETDLRRVFAAKVAGVVNLDRATEGEDLDLFLVFSSIAGTMGNPGQADYAAANCYLDHYVKERNRRTQIPGGPKGLAISIAWPYWAEGGMRLDTAAIAAMRDGTGLAPLSTAKGLKALDRIVSGGWPQTMVLEGDGSRLTALITGVAEELPIKTANTPDPGPPPNRLRSAVEVYLAEELAKLLRIPKQRLEADVPLVEYGVDSVAVMALTASIEVVTGSLPATLFFENPTIEAAAKALTDLAPDVLMEALHVSEPAGNLPEASSQEDAGRSSPWRTRVPEVESKTATTGESGGHIGASDPVETPLPLTKGQIALWLHDQKYPGDSAYTVPVALRLSGVLDRDKLRSAIADLHQRHQILASVFISDGGEPKRVVRAGVSCPTDERDMSAVPDGVIEKELQHFVRLPFDLAEGPLIRCLLIREAEEQHILMICVHHIVYDGQSAMVLVEEFLRRYEARLQGRGLPVSNAVPFGTFQSWQADLLASERGTALRAFWREELKDHEELFLPGDWDAAAGGEAISGNHAFRIDADMARTITKTAAGLGATPAQFMMAAFTLILHRLTGSDDLMIGLPVLGRPDRSFDHSIGFFANLLPIRIRQAGSKVTIRDLVAATRQAMLRALEHGDLPLSEIGDVSRADHPVTPRVQFAFQSLVSSESEGAGSLKVSTVDGINQQGVQDLALEVYPAPEGMRCRFAFDTERFKSDTVAALADTYKRVLAAFLNAPEARLADLALAGPQDPVLVEWGHGGAPSAGDALISAWRAQGRIAPDAPAVICGDAVLTYAMLERAVENLATRLVNAGIGPGDVVASCLTRTPAALVAALATWWAGAVHMPLSPAQPSSRLNDMIADGAPVLALTEPETESLLGIPQMRVEWPSEALQSGNGAISTPVVQDPAGAAYILFTSGSTGRPKGIKVPHRALVHHIHAMASVFAIGRQDLVLQFAETSFDASFEQWLAPLVRGAAVVMRPEVVWSAPDFAEAVQRHGITLADLPPAFMDEVLRALDRSDDWGRLQSLRMVVTGGEALSERALNAWRASPLADRTLANIYGPTETTIGSTAFFYYAQQIESETRLPIGRPLPGETAFVLDAAGQPLPAGLIGELAIGGVGLADGYIGAQTGQGGFSTGPGSAADRLYHTGDLVRWRADGQLEFLGRRDSQISIRGFRVETAEVEAALERIDGVLRAAVTVSIRKSIAEMRAHVAVSDPSLEPAAIARALKRELPAYMWPSEIHIVSSLPQTIAGKLDRQSLKSMPVSDVSEPTDPGNRTEKMLAGLWGELLDRPSVPVTKNIFELGAHSLQLIRFAGEVRSRLGAELSVAQLFQAPTVSEQARLIENSDDGCSSVVRLQTGPGPTLVLVHGGIGTLLCYRDLLKHSDPALSILGVEGTQENSWETVEDAAAVYLADLKAFQVETPFHLAGWSSGGVIAWEMARQMKASGHDLMSLTLIDSYSPQALAHLESQLRFHGSDGALLAGFARDMGVKLELQSGAFDGESDTLLKVMAESTGEDPQVLYALFNTYRQVANAIDGYVPNQLSVPTLALHAQGLKFLEAIRSWPHGDGIMEFQAVEGDHLSMLQGEQSKGLANILGSKIRTHHG
jgi:amino acid adenylation domain-containing protein